MRADQWAGLVTKASPYAIPPGAAVEQTNLTCSIPGQLTSRNGMRPVAFINPTEDIVDCFPQEYEGKVRLLVLTTSGVMYALKTPAYGDSVHCQNDFYFTLPSGQTGTSYTQRFAVGPIAESSPTPPSSDPYVSDLDAGDSDIGAPAMYAVVSGQEVNAATYEYAYNGGSSSTPSYPPSFLESRLPPNI